MPGRQPRRSIILLAERRSSCPCRLRVSPSPAGCECRHDRGHALRFQPSVLGPDGLAVDEGYELGARLFVRRFGSGWTRSGLKVGFTNQRR